MIGLTILVIWILVLVLIWHVAINVVDDVSGGVLVSLGWLVLSVFVIPLGLYLGPGFWPDRGEIVRDGYLMRANVRGIIWKTCEVEIVTGFGGDAASLTYQFSTDANKCVELRPMLSKAVRVEASEWIVLPATLGESDALITSIAPAGEHE